MTGRFSLAGLARLCARRGWIVVALWLFALALAGVATVSYADSLTSDDEFTRKPESTRAWDLMQERMPPREPGQGGPTETIIIRASSSTVDDPAFRTTVEEIATALRGVDGAVREAPTYYDAVAADDPRAGLLVSADRTTTIIPAGITWQGRDAFLDRLSALKVEHAPSGIEILAISEPTIDDEIDRLLGEDLVKAELFGLPTALIVLVIVFGALVAAGLPIVLALVSIGIAIGLTAAIGSVTNMSVYAINMITMIGLAVGIDYALFIVDRYREERRHGRPKLDAIGVAGGTANKAVLFSGLTVVLALTGMFMLPTTLFHGLGAGAILVVIVAVAASLTLIPALLGLLGDKINWPRRQGVNGVASQESGVRELSALGTRYSVLGTGFWARITRLVMARPIVSVALVSTLLIALSLPYFDMQRGTAGGEALPDGEIKRAYQILEADFAAGLIDPVQIVVDGRQSPEVDAAIDRLVGTLETDPAFGQVTRRDWAPDGDLAVIEIPLRANANDAAAYEAIEHLRENLIPQAFAGTGARALVSGDAATNVDFNALVDDGTPRIFAFVLGLSFLLLLLAFRSIVVPLKAILMNLLSVGATYGLLVLVFQKGYGADFFGFQQTPTIEAWVPIFLFCVLFGLSMDYHVFLLSRIREHYDLTHHNRESVTVGLQATARLITGAALIMVAVFAGFASGSLVMFQQIGFGLAVAVFLDATVVRSILVPASMTLLGDRNWYLPSWLAWLPDLRVEGHPPVFSTTQGDD
ncbi:MAG: MMPL family transporter [Thermomicrobiales bacterium]